MFRPGASPGEGDEAVVGSQALAWHGLAGIAGLRPFAACSVIDGSRQVRHSVKVRDLPPDSMQKVFLPDSWVLAVEWDAGCLCLELDAVLEEGHPLYYYPPKQGEQYPYAHLRWCLRGEVHWNEGPNLAHRAPDPDGSVDYGNVDAWFQEGDVEHLEGDWGAVVIVAAAHTVTLLS